MPDKWKDGEDAMTRLNQLNLKGEAAIAKNSKIGAQRPRLRLTSKAYKYVLRNQ
jgi:hypothetical protein